MGLLSGGGAALFGELFASLYLPATVTKAAETFDDQGNMRRGTTERGCLAQVDRCTERMVATEGYTDTDRGIYILATSLAGDADTDCEIVVHAGEYAGTRWRLASPIDRDPCAAYWLARGTRVKTPVAPGG